MRPGTSLESDLLWFIASAASGVTGFFALIYPLFGFLNYGAALAFPFVLLAEIAFGIVGVIARGRWRRGYVLGNLGMVAGNIVTFVAAAISVANPAFQSDPTHWSPAYFGVVLIGLAGGITLAVLRPRSEVRR